MFTIWLYTDEKLMDDLEDEDQDERLVLVCLGVLLWPYLLIVSLQDDEREE